MKKIIINSVLIIFTLLLTSNLNAQIMETKPSNYVILTKKVDQLKPIILAAEGLKKEQGAAFGDFKVIICGKGIGDITDPEKMKDFVEKAKKAGVEIVACGFSLNKFKIDQTKIPKEIQTVENGILYNLQLQNKGYKSLSL